MLTHHEKGADEEERWPLLDRDPAVAARLREAGVRLATGSLDRERQVAKRRPAWLAFILRAANRVGATVRQLLRKRKPGADEVDDLEDLWTSLDAAERVRDDRWPRREADPVMDAWLRSMNIRPATHSLDHPRPVMNQWPAWLAILLNRLKVRS